MLGKEGVYESGTIVKNVDRGRTSRQAYHEQLSIFGRPDSTIEQVEGILAVLKLYALPMPLAPYGMVGCISLRFTFQDLASSPRPRFLSKNSSSKLDAPKSHGVVMYLSETIFQNGIFVNLVEQVQAHLPKRAIKPTQTSVPLPIAPKPFDYRVLTSTQTHHPKSRHHNPQPRLPHHTTEHKFVRHQFDQPRIYQYPRANTIKNAFHNESRL